jgi:hypothetical protein
VSAPCKGTSSPGITGGSHPDTGAAVGGTYTCIICVCTRAERRDRHESEVNHQDDQDSARPDDRVPVCIIRAYLGPEYGTN